MVPSVEYFCDEQNREKRYESFLNYQNVKMKCLILHIKRQKKCCTILFTRPSFSEYNLPALQLEVIYFKLCFLYIYKISINFVTENAIY